MKKKRLILGIILIILGLTAAIPATLTITTCIKSLLNPEENNSAGFYIGSVFGAILLWVLVFTLVIGGVKLIRSKPKKKVTYISPFDKFK